MPIDFPTSPTTGQVYTYLGKSWVYNGTAWDAPKALSEIGAVQTFANAAARTSAIPTPTEGIVTWLNDSNSLQVYDGAVWTAAGGVGSGNVIINGGFDIWQRGTAITVTTDMDSGTSNYTADRMAAGAVDDGVSWRSLTVTRSTDTIPGLKYSAKFTSNNTTSNAIVLRQKLEDTVNFGGGPATISFFIKRIATFNGTQPLRINDAIVIPDMNTLSTSSFTRVTSTIPVYNNDTVNIIVGTREVTAPEVTTATGDLFLITGLQLEAGTVATPFKRNAPSIQAELAACMRYFQAYGQPSQGQVAMGTIINSTQAITYLRLMVEMRVAPTFSSGAAGLFGQHVPGVFFSSVTAISLSSSTTKLVSINSTAGAGFTGGHAVTLEASNAGAFIHLSAEL
jgi:hypothetical protein